jgi:hypothetical protein
MMVLITVRPAHWALSFHVGGASLVEPGIFVVAIGIVLLGWGGLERPRTVRVPAVGQAGPGGYRVQLACGHVVIAHASKTEITANLVQCVSCGPRRVVRDH